MSSRRDRSTATAEEASDAGQKTFEHLLSVLPACSSREKELLEASQGDVADMLASGKPSFTGPRQRALREALLNTYDPDKASQLFARFKKNGTWQCPTLTVLRSLAYQKQASFRDDPRLKYVPHSVRAFGMPPLQQANKDQRRITPSANACLKKTWNSSVR